MNAYKESYLNNAADAFGYMMDYVVGDCKIDGDVFLHMFITSGLAEQFEHGNPKIIAGMSGLELARQAITATTGEAPTAEYTDDYSFKTPEFWAGWALCQYQWYCARSFATILRFYPFADIVKSYHPLHEADISKFYAAADERYKATNPQTNLKRLRELRGWSQSQLAEESGVSLRSIQMYEQRNKDVNRASAISLSKIARALGCDIEDLLESEPNSPKRDD